MSERRWASEEAVLAELERLGDESLERAREYQALAQAAAEAEATHKALRAKRVLLAKANGVKSISHAEYIAEADSDVAEAYLLRLTTLAAKEACQEALRSIRTNQEALRTAAASARDGVVGPGFSGRR